MALLDISNLTFAHEGGQTIFDNVSLQLDTNWKLGLIGRNGRGKTTFLKLLLGEHAHGGRILAPVQMRYFPFPAPSPELSARAVAASIVGDLEPWRLEREASLLDLSREALDRPFATLSGGEATKLLLAALFLREDAFPLIDEPTNHLDVKARRVLGAYLRRKKGFILVSHDRALLDASIDHVLSINRAGVELQRGNFSSWQANRMRNDERERADSRKLKKEIIRLEQSAGRSENWSRAAEKEKFGNGPVDRGYIGRKAAKMMQRAKAVEARRNRAVEEKSRLLRDIETEAPLTLRPLIFHGRRLARLEYVSVVYGGNGVLENLSFEVMQGERLLLRGKNGSGKSSLLRALAGKSAACEGNIFLPEGLRVSYVPQDSSWINGTLKAFSCNRNIRENLLRAVLHRFGFERSQFDTPLEDLSAGQKKKVLLAASLCEEAHLYVWDEPLNYIDVISRMQIEHLILQCRPGMVLVEHDSVFTGKVATSVIDLDEMRAR